MKKLSILAAVMAVFLFNASAAKAETTFAVVDMNVVLQDSSAAKSILKQLEEKREVYKKQIEGKETQLRSEEQKIVKEKDNLSKNEFEKKRDAFKDEVIEGHKLAQKSKVILDRAFNSSMAKLRKEIAKVVAEIAKDKKLSAVFTENAVIISDPSLDITKDVVSKLDSDVKNISVDWSEAEKVPADATPDAAPAEPAKKGKK